MTSRGRLPTNLVPSHYELYIRTDLATQSFSGSVKIHLDVSRETTEIVLHALQLELYDAFIITEKGKFTLSDPILDTDVEQATYAAPQPLKSSSKLVLHISFKAMLEKRVQGYYLSPYVDKSGKVVHHTATQFQPTCARLVYPCWDEPALKATFTVTMTSRANTVNLSNMPVVSEQTFGDGGDDEWKTTHFQTTPPMSTYLVAFANGDFLYKETTYTSPLTGTVRPLRIYATPDIISETQFALDVTAKIVPIYEKLFDVEFPLPKLDTIVVNAFPGGMENWGLITGTGRLYTANLDETSRKNLTSMQAHEVAHMWFGDITTMKWWDNTYLNEGFATWVADAIVADMIHPEWKFGSMFITTQLNRALVLDAKLSSHPVQVDIPDSKAVAQIFDPLSYDKAASLIRMFSEFIGQDLFIKGVSRYLKAHLYGNTVTKDLWDSITAVSGVDVVRIIDPWFVNMGYPLITVVESPTGIHVRQDRFLATGKALPEDNETIWTVPLSIFTVEPNMRDAVIDKTVVLDTRDTFIQMDTSGVWKLNAGTVGFYRVLYTPKQLAKIIETFSSPTPVFSLDDILGLVQDAFAVSRAGYMNLSSAFGLVEGLQGQEEYLVWSGISDNLISLKQLEWLNEETIQRLNGFCADTYRPILSKLGYDYLPTDSSDIVQLRSCAILMGAESEDAEVVAELCRRFPAILAMGGTKCTVPAEMQRIVFSTALKFGGKEEYDAVRKLYDLPKTNTSNMNIVISLCQTTSPHLISQTLDFIKNVVTDVEIVLAIRALVKNTGCAGTKGFRSPQTGRSMFRDWIKENFDQVVLRFQLSISLFTVVGDMLKAFSREEDLPFFDEFFTTRDTARYYLVLGQVVDILKGNVAFVKEAESDLLEWLRSRK